MQKDAAKFVCDLMLECGRKLDQSLVQVKDACSTEEYETYRRTVGALMGTMFLDVMRPIYAEHPELEPEDLKPRSGLPPK
jgi:hypothetical protein